ncbi:ribonuclease HepT family protein [Methanofollis ethanolicus]|uniref:hypothetical protein n=1 Tax=Methanofollis ethanolicus TaxID=488124 RepID=UPI00082CB9C9|nr:hypothetical protein [Methanofollis ethanolicus]
MTFSLTIFGEAAKNGFATVMQRISPRQRPQARRTGYVTPGVDYGAVFVTVRDDLPLLKQGIQAIFDEADRTTKG